MTDRPSDTAWIIALMRVLAKRDPDFAAVMPDPDEPYSRWFVEARPDTRKWLQALSWEPLRRLLFANGERKTPGGMMHILLRKRYIEDQLRHFLDDADGKPRQVVVFGAGMDPLPVRMLNEYPAAAFFEIDHPNSLGVKQAAFAQHGIADPRLILLPIDFSQQSAEARLPRVGFRRDVPNFFLAEGLLMYLDQADIDSLFTQVRSLSAPGSRFLFTFLDTDLLHDPRSPVSGIRRRLDRIGEPLVSSMRPTEVATFVRSHRMRLLELISADDLRRHYLDPLGIQRPILAGELLALLEP
jgi:methyltransferase (TIGR00027 family)